jgi:pimeloyl-ACP methyl ester carboxylesterase
VRAADGCELRVTDLGGDGPPIVLLHGLMGRGSTWWAASRWLARRGRVLAPDARGHGRSGGGGPWTTSRFAADVVTVLEGTGPATVIGHSMGGLHALAAAAARPDLVRRIIVEDMAVDFTGVGAAHVVAMREWFAAMPQPWPSLAAVREAFGGGPDGDFMAECVEERDGGWRLLTDVGDAWAIAAAWAREARWDLLPHVRCPALLLEAERSVTPAGQMKEMAERMRDARHEVVAGSGHLVHAAPACQALVEAFLD